MEHSSLNLPERLLANKLAELLAQKMESALPRVDSEIYNHGQSNYECACHALNLVGVFQQAEHYTRHKIIVPAGRVSQHMGNLGAVTREAFETLLSAFIENFIGYDCLTAYRCDFTGPEELLSALTLLARCGYAEQTMDRFRWTDKVAPWMQRWHYWDNDNICKAEQIDRLETAIANELDASMPPRVRRMLVSALKSSDPRPAFAILERHLHGRQWREFPFSQKSALPENDSAPVTLAILSKLLRLLKK